MRNIKGILKQKSLFDQYASLQDHELSTFHFFAVFLWQDFFNFEFQVINESLCVFADQDPEEACFLYLPPLSKKFDHSVVEQCFEKMNRINHRTARIENVEEKDLKYFKDHYKVYAKSAEYVYRKEDLVLLKGNTYKSQRHDINHLIKHHQALYRPYTKEDSADCMELYRRWAQNRYEKHDNEIYRAMLEESKISQELALNYHEVLGLIGYVVEIDQKIAAYSLGYVLNSKTFCVSLEITDPQITGLNSFIFNRFCASDQIQDIELINTMDDFGMPNVAVSKDAYHPAQKPVSYNITQK